MELSIIIARILGPFYLLFMLSLLLSNRNLNMLIKLSETDLFNYLAGLINAGLGLVIVIFHNVWIWEWFIVITIIGYIHLIIGLGALFTPASAKKTKKDRQTGNNAGLKAFLIFDTCLILVFNYFAFFI